VIGLGASLTATPHTLLWLGVDIGLEFGDFEKPYRYLPTFTADVAGILKGYPVARELKVEEFLSGPIPQKTPSILNARELELLVV
jgi:hypothetical protein